MKGFCNMNRCHNCLFWQPYHKGDPAHSIGMCTSEKFAKSVTAVIQSYIPGEWPTDGKYDGYETYLDFGCNLWREKE